MNSYETTDFLLKYVLNKYPGIDERDIDKAVAMNDYDLLIRFKDGEEVIYDTYSNISHGVSNLKTTPTDEILRNELKDRLYILMCRKGIDESELARRINSTQPMISRYMTGRSIPNAITLKKIAMVLDCSVDDFWFKRF